MTRIANYADGELARLLKSTGVYLNTGPFIFHVRSSVPDMVHGIRALYGDYSLLVDEAFADHHVEVRAGTLSRRWVRPEIQFFHNGDKPFLPVSFNQAFALFEWGMNWCISHFPNQYLKLHAAVLEKNGRAVIMPGLPGAGKSTLSAALTLSGWRLLSDEHALITLDRPAVVPLCRPVGLKNESIDIIRKFSSKAVIGPLSMDTHKGTVAHMKADLSAQSHSSEPVDVAWIIFPQYQAQSDINIQPITRGAACIRAAEQSFNYSVLGERGFQAMAAVCERSACYDFQYSNLEEAVELFDRLVSNQL